MKCLSVKIFVVFLSVCFLGCKDEYSICEEPKDVRFIASIYQKSGNTDILTSVPSLNLYSIQGATSIYASQPNISSFNIPLSVSLDSAKYLISFSNSLPVDTLTIVYTSEGKINLSPNCPPIFIHNITKAYSTFNTIDSIKIINQAVNASLSQNAKIYF
jgi:Family of unknown function (DUF6452)